MPTTFAHPTCYRPQATHYSDPNVRAKAEPDDPKLVQWEYMEHWELYRGLSTGIIPGTVSDSADSNSGKDIDHDADTNLISEQLQERWEL